MKVSDILCELDTAWAGREIIYFEETDSTNTQAKKKKDACHGTLFVADRQTAGRGRLGRNWESPRGENIYMSLLLRPSFSPEKASMLTLVMALSVLEAVKEQTGLELEIKWPNDIILHKKKVCGILTEMLLTNGGGKSSIDAVVIGVGINVNQQDFPAELQETATSLRGKMGHVSRESLIVKVMQRFEENYETFLETEDLSVLAETYNQFLVNRGKEVRVLEPGGEYTAIAKEINEKGELVAVTAKGEEKHIFAGEVSVRGIYGYV